MKMLLCFLALILLICCVNLGQVEAQQTGKQGEKLHRLPLSASTAAKRGLDDNRWFNNVEMVTADRIGSETTTYVRNVYKYYAAYKLVQERRQEQQKTRRQTGDHP